MKDKLLVLRYSRLGRLPPALYGTQMLVEQGYPVLVVEFGNLEEATIHVDGRPPRLRMASPWARFLPGPLRSPLIFLSIFLRLWWQCVRQGKPMAIWAHGGQEQVIAYLLRWTLGVRYVVHVHESYDGADPMSPFNRWLFRREGRALRHAELLIFPEATRARLYQQRYRLRCPVFLAFNAPRLRTKATGIDFRARLALPPDSILMAYVGGIADVNVLAEGIQALAGLPRLHFLIWGYGDSAYQQRMVETAKAAGVEPRVHFLGELDGEKWEALDGCDIGYCVYRPTLFRLRYAATASNKLMEYWAAGLPVLTSNADDFKQLLSQYQVGSWAPDLTPEGIRDGLHSLIYDEMGLKRKAVHALDAHRSRFHFETQFHEALDYFRRHFPPPESVERLGDPSSASTATPRS